MPKKPRVDSEQPIFRSVRKPTPPPSRKLGEEKADEKIYPSRRKIKHKKKIEIDLGNGDF